MLLGDARRLMGPNLLSRSPLVLAELALGPGDTAASAVALYREELARMRAALGMATPAPMVLRESANAVAAGYEAPIDVMLACAEISEWAGMSASERSLGREPLPLPPKQDEIAEMLRAQESPALRALVAAAAERGVPLLWDDDEVSVGSGSRSQRYARNALPAVAEVPWSRVGSIPIAMITGTNGKTTSSRLLAHIASGAGHRVGATSSDAITIGGVAIERGDCTGPFAARTVLRNREVDFAVLETARGGILRRGLAVSACDVALITNISDDHLGLYGIDTLTAMAEVKGVVGRIATRAVVLNTNDPRLSGLAPSFSAPVLYFADLAGIEPPPALAAHLASGGRAVVARADELVLADGGDERVLVRLDAVPITFGGVARYNVENVAGVVAAALALGLPEPAIIAGLASFNANDNPGRGQLVEHRGVRVMLDYGHNPAGVSAVLKLVEGLIAKRPGPLSIVAGSAGDRTDAEIDEMAAAIVAASPSRVYLRELPDYLRGRALGDVSKVFRQSFRRLGLADEKIEDAPSEVAAVERIVERATSGDFALVLVHLEHAAMAALLARR